MTRPIFDSTIGPTLFPQHFSIIDRFVMARSIARVSPDLREDPACEILSNTTVLFKKSTYAYDIILPLQHITESSAHMQAPKQSLR